MHKNAITCHKICNYKQTYKLFEILHFVCRILQQNFCRNTRKFMQKYVSKLQNKYANIVKIWTQYAEICRNMRKNMQKYVMTMPLYAGIAIAYIHP